MADYGATWQGACTSGVCYVQGGGEPFTVGQNAGSVYRSTWRFDIAALEAGAAVSDAEITMYVESINNIDGSQRWKVGPYNGDGQADPEVDDVATRWTRSDVSTDFYEDQAYYGVVGWKTEIFSSASYADIEAARIAGTIFSVSFMLHLNGGWDRRCRFNGFTTANAPILTINTSGVTLIAPLLKSRGEICQG